MTGDILAQYDGPPEEAARSCFDACSSLTAINIMEFNFSKTFNVVRNEDGKIDRLLVTVPDAEFCHRFLYPDIRMW